MRTITVDEILAMAGMLGSIVPEECDGDIISEAQKMLRTLAAERVQCEPVAWMREAGAPEGSETSVITKVIRNLWLKVNPELVERYTIPLYRHAERAQQTGVVTDEVAAWATHHETPMLFLDRAEAETYCDDDECPIPLYAASPSPEKDNG